MDARLTKYMKMYHLTENGAAKLVVAENDFNDQYARVGTAGNALHKHIHGRKMAQMATTIRMTEV